MSEITKINEKLQEIKKIIDVYIEWILIFAYIFVSTIRKKIWRIDYKLRKWKIEYRASKLNTKIAEEYNKEEKKPKKQETDGKTEKTEKTEKENSKEFVKEKILAYLSLNDVNGIDYEVMLKDLNLNKRILNTALKELKEEKKIQFED